MFAFTPAYLEAMVHTSKFMRSGDRIVDIQEDFSLATPPTRVPLTRLHFIHLMLLLTALTCKIVNLLELR